MWPRLRPQSETELFYWGIVLGKKEYFSASLYAYSMPVIHTDYYMAEVCLYVIFALG